MQKYLVGAQTAGELFNPGHLLLLLVHPLVDQLLPLPKQLEFPIFKYTVRKVTIITCISVENIPTYHIERFCFLHLQIVKVSQPISYESTTNKGRVVSPLVRFYTDAMPFLHIYVALYGQDI